MAEDKASIKTHKESLIKTYKELLSRDEEIRNHMGKGIAQLGRDFGGDAGDVASDANIVETNVTILKHDTNELRQIAIAIAKLRDGTYGLCECCSKPIPAERIEALPYAASCVSCQTKVEHGQVQEGDGPDWSKIEKYPISDEDLIEKPGKSKSRSKK